MPPKPRHQLLPVLVGILQNNMDILQNTDPELLQAAKLQNGQYFFSAHNEPRTLYCTDKTWDITLSLHKVTEVDCQITWEVKVPRTETSSSIPCYDIEAEVVHQQSGHKSVLEISDNVTIKDLREPQDLEIRDLHPGATYHVTFKLVQRFQVGVLDWRCVLARKKISVMLKKYHRKPPGNGTRTGMGVRTADPVSEARGLFQDLHERLQQLGLHPGDLRNISQSRFGSLSRERHPQGNGKLASWQHNGQRMPSAQYHSQRGNGYSPQDWGPQAPLGYGCRQTEYHSPPERGASGFGSARMNHRSPMVNTHLQALHRKASSVLSNNNNITCIQFLYRNKPFPYFEEIIKRFHGDMVPYTKDNNGDPRSPINGRLKGLFFSGATDDEGGLPTSSPFGNTRFIVPVHRLFYHQKNLYFTDFYCNNKSRHPHYITLVLTEMGSRADHFCQSLGLLPLDRYRNPYLCLDPDTEQVWISTTVWIELLYTETINVLHEVSWGGAQWDFDVEIMGKGTSSPGGIPKNTNCEVCNV